MTGQLNPDHMMTIAAARWLIDCARRVCFVGIGIPSQAANLARQLGAQDLILIYESGTIGVQPSVLPLSIGDGELASTARSIVPMSELFGYWLQGGRIEVGFLGAAQIDKFANLNSTVLGDYEAPRVRLPGAGGAPDIAAFAQETLIILRHKRDKLVEQLDFTTSVGYLDGNDGRRQAGLSGGPKAVITNLAILRPEQPSNELIVTDLMPGVTPAQVADATGWPVRFAEKCNVVPPASQHELAVWNDLQQRTSAARETF